MKARWLLPMALVLASASSGCDRLGFGGGDRDSVRDTPTVDSSVFLAVAFDGYVYVDPASSNSKIIERVRHATQSVMRGLLKKKISVSGTSQVKVDVKSFVRDPVQIVAPNVEKKPALRVRFHYEAEAIAPESATMFTDLEAGMLVTDDTTRFPKVLGDCTQNSSHDQEFTKTPWYVFDVSLESCSRAVLDENVAIDHARSEASLKPDEITPDEFARVYLPVHIRLLQKEATRDDDRRASNDPAPNGDSNSPGSNGPGSNGRPGTSRPSGPQRTSPGDPTPTDPSLRATADPDTKAPGDPDQKPPGENPEDPKVHLAPKDKVPSDGLSFDYAAAGQQLNWVLIPFALLAAYLILRKGSGSA